MYCIHCGDRYEDPGARCWQVRVSVPVVSAGGYLRYRLYVPQCRRKAAIRDDG